MGKFYFQIKGKGADNNWQWPPLESGLVESDNSKSARKEIEEMFGMKMPGGRLKNEADKQQLLLSIIDTDNKPYLLTRFETKRCAVCQIEFTLNDKYMLSRGGSSAYCSSECDKKMRSDQDVLYGANFDFDGIHEAVVYKITNKATGLCYIGKTTQAFTLRWYQHFYQGSHGAKFYEARKQYDVTNWTFEVIEIIPVPKGASRDEKKRFILRCESYWMNQYDSVKNGYNSLLSIENEAEESDAQMNLFEMPNSETTAQECDATKFNI